MKKIDKRSFAIGLMIGAVPLLLWGAVAVISSAQAQEAQAPKRMTGAGPVVPQTQTAPATPMQADTAQGVNNPKLMRGPGPVVGKGNSQQRAQGQGDNAQGPRRVNPRLRRGPGSALSPSVKEFPGSSAQWQNAFEKDWIAAEKERHMIKPPADNKAILDANGTQKEGDTYGNYTASDLLLWEKETERLVVMGSMIFHNADLLGSTNGTSCDMCHPDGEGTHAETYPKYQVQLGRAALLRDMANWCLENPCRAEPMSGDDYRMRALEAYMQAQRTGKPMKYGKH